MPPEIVPGGRHAQAVSSGASPQLFLVELLREDHSTWFRALQGPGGLALLQPQFPTGNSGPFSR